MKKLFYIGPRVTVWYMTYYPYLERYHTEGGPQIAGICEGIFMSELEAKIKFKYQLIDLGYDMERLDAVFANNEF